MCPASLSTTPFSLQWATMAFDVPFLQPTNGPIISDAMQGMSYDTPIPEIRVAANISWDKLWKGFNSLATASCMGLMNNYTALHFLQVRNSRRTAAVC